MTTENLKKQMDEYRKVTKAKSGGEVYTLSQEIIFMEGIAAHIDALCKQDVSVGDAIEAAGEDKTLQGCAKHLMAHAKKNIGNHGDLPSGDMAMLIWDYFMG